jgi:hypothetical protein
MKKQEQTILTTHSKGIDSVGEPAAPASLGVLKEEARAWHRIYCAENSWTETGSRRWLQMKTNSSEPVTSVQLFEAQHDRRRGTVAATGRSVFNVAIRPEESGCTEPTLIRDHGNENA